MIQNTINTTRWLWSKIRKYHILLILMTQGSCKRLVEAPPPSNTIGQSNVYANDATAIAVLTGIYTNLTKTTGSGVGGFTGIFSLSAMCGLSADEFSLYSGVDYNDLKAYYSNQLNPNAPYSTGSEYWPQFYNYIYICNAAIEGLGNSISLTPSVKQQLLGEAKFMRGFFYFYLVNLYGDVPLVTSTDYKTNTILHQASKIHVYQQILSDLNDAKNLLTDKYLDPTLLKTTNERVRPTSWAAHALMARTYLFMKDWSKAESEATIVINNIFQYSLNNLNEVFLKNSKESIWQLQPTTLFLNTADAAAFIIPSTGLSDNYPLYLNETILNSFEIGDQRAQIGTWIDSIRISGTTYYYPYKYKINLQDPTVISASQMNEYLMILRLGELYLIRAEARAEQNNINGSQEDLNLIRERAGLLKILSNNKESLLLDILHERQVELFTEWGHRWLDLKRTNKIDETMKSVTPQKTNGGSWHSFQQWYPLPISDLKLSPFLVQNAGYQ